jgi:Protein of unknown function (DUF2634).
MSYVSILPQGAIINDIEIKKDSLQVAKTYKIKDNKIVGFCDGKEALKQTIYFILSTERYNYLIYSNSYGSELNLISELDRDIAKSELKRRISEAILQDDRVNNVTNFEFSYEKDSVLIKFTVFSIYGDIKIEKEVN